MYGQLTRIRAEREKEKEMTEEEWTTIRNLIAIIVKDNNLMERFFGILREEATKREKEVAAKFQEERGQGS